MVARPAMAADGEFSLQVSPSPLVATVKPGQSTVLELNVRNNGPTPENLKIVPRAFKIDNQTQQLQISDDQMPDIASWLHFSAPTFSLESGRTTTEKVTLAVPSNAGFSYAFALAITRAGAEAPTSGRALQAKVVVFALINVDRPGAVRALEVTRFTTTKGVYDYLPVTFQIDFKNTGNTIVQPSGNVFVQRGPDDKTPISTLTVNDSGAYILPGATRTLSATWDDGFQVVTKKTQPDGSQKDELTWNWNKLSSIRFGEYTAKLVAIFDDGHRDIPLDAQTKFWVFPWQMLLAILAIVALVGAGLWVIVSNIVRLTKRIGHKKLKL